MKKYDIIVAGAGASGVFLTYEQKKPKNPAKKSFPPSVDQRFFSMKSEKKSPSP